MRRNSARETSVHHRLSGRESMDHRGASRVEFACESRFGALSAKAVAFWQRDPVNSWGRFSCYQPLKLPARSCWIARLTGFASDPRPEYLRQLGERQPLRMAGDEWPWRLCLRHGRGRQHAPLPRISHGELAPPVERTLLVAKIELSADYLGTDTDLSANEFAGGASAAKASCTSNPSP